MKKLYTAAEIAQKRLAGLPTTKSSILARAAKEGWYFEEQYGIGGLRKVFEVPDKYLVSDTKIKQGILSAKQTLSAYTADEPKANVHAEAGINETKLAIAARVTEEWIEEKQLSISHEMKGSLIATLYKIALNNADPDDLLKLMCDITSASWAVSQKKKEDSA